MPELPIDPPDENESFDPRLVEVLDQYMADRRAGTSPDHDELLAQHPDLADQLKSCLEGIDLLGKTPIEISGRKYLGDFEIGEEIGRGGMGVVYRAHQRSLDRTVALKILNLPISDPRIMERFQREASTAAGLHHTNIVPIFEVGSDGGTHYYAMQLIDGSSLAEVMRDSERPLDLDTLAKWGLQAADALVFAHEHGVIHRDIKPSNLILDREGQIWLTDFGLARRLDDARLSATGAVLGTPRYMSPEQAAAISHVVDGRTDIYSLGATLFELACGRPAVPGDTPVAVINSIMNEHRLSPREHRPAISRDLETILLRCLEKHPQDRYPDASVLASDLRALCEHRPISSRPLSMLEKSRRWLQQHRVRVRWAATGGFAAIALICMAVWFALVYPTLDDTHVQLSTTAPTLRATFVRLDGESDPVSVTVPTTDPIILDEGYWKGTLRQPGGFSHEVRHWFLRGEERALLLPAPPSELWSADNVVASFAIRKSDRTDLVVVTDTAIQMRHGLNGELIWSQDNGGDELALTNDRGTARYESAWGRFRATPRTTFQALPVCPIGQPDGSGDIDGDGQIDLLIASRTQPAILALSGADGSLLWKKMYAKDFGTYPGANGTYGVWIKTLSVGKPLAIFCSGRGRNATAWMVQLDPKDGSLQWTTNLSFKRQDFGKFGLASRYIDRGFRGPERTHWSHLRQYEFVQRVHRHPSWIHQHDMVPLITELSRDQIACALDRDVVVINRDDGSTISHADMLGADPVQPIQLMRGPEAERTFVVTTQTRALNSLDQFERMNLRVYNEDLSKLRWQRTVRADFLAPVCRLTDAPTLPMIVDLDRDGSDELVVQTDRVDLPNNQYHRGPVWAELQIINSAGKDLLPTPLRVPTGDAQLLHVQVVPDRNNDQRDDLAVATRYSSMRDERGAVHVELFCAASGERIWHQRLDHPQAIKENNPPEIARFQHVRLAGREFLLVETAIDSGFYGLVQHETSILDAGSGQVFSAGDGLSVQSILEPESGAPLLWCHDRTVIEPGDENSGRSRMKMFALPVDPTIHVAQSAKIAPDIDGDGLADLRVQRVSRRSFENPGFVSSATGKRLATPIPTSDVGQVIAARAIEGDLTGNGFTDLLAWSPQERLRLIEGSSGRNVWTLSDTLWIGEDHTMLAAVPASLTGSDRQDLIVAAYAEHQAAPKFGLAPWDKPLIIFGVRGTDGKVLWTHELGKVESTGGYESLQFTTGDVNDDDVTDFIFSYFMPVDTNAVYAVDGATGKRIVRWGEAHKADPNWLDRFPKPVVIGDGSRAKIVFLSNVGPNKGYELTIGNAMTGQAATEPIASKRSYMTRDSRENRWGRHEIVPLRSTNADQQRIAFWFANDDQKIELRVGDIQSGKFQSLHAPWIPEGNEQKPGAWKEWFRMLAADVDGDGNDELVAGRPGGFGAFGLDGNLLWSHDVDGSCAVLEMVRELDGTVECVASVPSNDRRVDVVGVGARDGKRHWIVRGQPGLKLVDVPTARGILNPKAELPTFAYTNLTQNFWLTARARPVGDHSKVLQPHSESARVAKPVVDTRMLGAGPYPGPADVFGARRWRFAGRLLWSVLWSFFGIIVPFVIVIRILRQRRFSLTLMLVATAAIAVCFTVMKIPVGNQLVTISDRFSMGLWMTPFFAWMWMLVAFYRRGQTVACCALLLSPLLIVCGYECYKTWTDSPERIMLAADLLRLWRGLLVTIPIVVVLGGPIWVPVWFSRRVRSTT